MIERFSLSDASLPALPTPHDCIIEKVSVDEEYIIFEFEHKIYNYDSIAFLHPHADSLIIRYHLCDPVFDTYQWKLHTTPFGREGYVSIDHHALPLKSKKGLAYLSHTIGYQAIMIKLWQGSHILIDANVDYVEYEWLG